MSRYLSPNCRDTPPDQAHACTGCHCTCHEKPMPRDFRTRLPAPRPKPERTKTR